MESALKRSRFEGTLRYLWKKGWQLILVTAGVVLLMEIAVYVLAVFVEGNVNLTSVSTMFSATGVIMFILMHRAANTDARFLITRATPRLSVCLLYTSRISSERTAQASCAVSAHSST